MEGSNEESDGHATNSTASSMASHGSHGKSLGKSHTHLDIILEASVNISTRDKQPGSSRKPQHVHSDEHDDVQESDLNMSAHVIDTTTYIPPDLDEKTEALLSTSIYLDPHDPFDTDTIQGFLDKLDRPLSSYPNYVRETGNIRKMTAKENVSLGM